MIPQALRLSNFRSFKKEQEFTFPDKPGLYFMQGVNESEPKLEHNGAGKSTLWEALTWAVFGKTSRGLKAGDVGNWEAGKGTHVEFDFVAPSGEEATLVRTWKPNSWILHDQHSSGAWRDDLDKSERNAFFGWLGIDRIDPWLHSVMMSQNQPMFLDLKAEAKSQLFAEVMNLERWTEYSSRASKAAQAVDRNLRLAENRMAEIRGEIKALGRQDLAERRKAWEEQRSRRLDEIDAALAQAEEYSTLADDLHDAEAKESRARQDLREALEPADRLADNLKAAQKRYRDAELDLARVDNQMEAAYDRRDAAAKTGRCSACGQAISSQNREVHLREALAALAALEVKMEEASADLRRAAEDVEALQAKLRAADDEVDVLRRRVRDVEDGARRLRLDKLAEDKRLDQLEDEAADLSRQENPFEAMERQQESRRRHLEIERRDLQHEISEGQWRHSLLSFWAGRGFKEVRLQEIGAALSELEIEVNSAVSALGLADWSLLFQLDRENKAGGLTRGFNAFVQSPHNSRGVPWEAWSGGEAQRLRLAGNMGLADLVRSRTGLALNLEVWDEPTQGLSPQGVRDLLEALEQRARQEQRIIWIVDHRSHEFGGFAGKTTVIKTPSGSRIRQEWYN